MSRLNRTTTSVETNTTTLLSQLQTQVEEQNRLISELSNRVQDLENFKKSKDFELQSTPVPKSKNNSPKKTASSTTISPDEKVVKKSVFLKELGNSIFSYFKFDDDETKYSHDWNSLFEYIEMDVSDITKFSSTIYKKAIDLLLVKENKNMSICYIKKDITYVCHFTSADISEISVESDTTKVKVSPSKKVSKTKTDEPTIINDPEEFKSKINFSKLEEFNVDNDNLLDNYKENSQEHKPNETITINKLYKHYIGTYKGRKTASDLFVELISKFELDNKVVFVKISKTKESEVFIYKTQENEENEEEDSY